MAKEKKIKVPKQIAGMKVPKKVRKAGNKALKLADNPAALELAAAALTAAAAALQAQGRKARAEERSSEEGGAVRLADLAKVAALEGARRLLDSMARPAGGGEQQAGQPDKPKRKKANGGAAADGARDG